jgi:tetratricopeptide (TPR) repeat protein
VPDNLRIEELRRRVQKDPASIAFAQLAEEHRRIGQFDEAIAVAKAGLAQHPAYLSARVTLGRALLELGRLDEAATEFEYVVHAAPDNLTAVRQLADIHQRRRQGSSQPQSKPPAIKPAEIKPAETKRADIKPVEIKPVEIKPAERPAIAFPSVQFTAAAPSVPKAPTASAPAPPQAPAVARPAVVQPAAVEDSVIAELEAWLAVLASERVAPPGTPGTHTR